MRTRNTRDVESTFGNFVSNPFTVAVNGKTFDILLDKMYTNKVQSVVRELWTNAHDAHVAAGVADQPFHCKLPTALDANFSVRDYGCSMTDDEATNLYTTVFASSKTQGTGANNFVGALGLGSKSPFAYTDSFVVTCWLDGIKRTYLAARGADGIPTFTPLTREPSEEPRGVEVSFPVQVQHFGAFRKEATAVAAGFDVKPTVPGLEFTTEAVLFEGSNWRVVKGDDSRLAIRQGCVIYPVRDVDITTGLQYSHTLVVDVPIGSVEVAPNRESLSLDDITTANVKRYAEAAAAELKAQVLAHIADAADAFEAHQRAIKVTDFMSLSGNKPLYNGQPLDGIIKFKASDEKNTPQSISNISTKPVAGGLNIHVSNAAKVRFVISRTDLKLPRKTTRFREWRRSVPSREKQHTFILTNPTTRQLAHLVRRLHLRAGQIIPIASMPDVKIERLPRPKKPVHQQVGGVYDLDGKPVQELPKAYHYVTVRGIAAREFHLGQLGTVDRGSALRQLTALHEMLELAEPVVLMTNGAVARFKPSSTFLDLVEPWMKANSSNLIAPLITSAAREALAQAAWDYSIMTPRVLDQLLPSTGKTFGWEEKRVLTVYLGEDVRGAARSAVKLAETVIKRFPLLFKPAEHDIINYINQIKE